MDSKVLAVAKVKMKIAVFVTGGTFDKEYNEKENNK